MLRILVLIVAVSIPCFGMAQVIDVTMADGDGDTSTFKPFEPIEIKHGEGARVQVIPWGTQIPEFLPERNLVRKETFCIFCAPPGFYMVNADGILRFVKISGEMPKPPEPPKPPGPVNPTIPEPSASLKSAVASIKAKLSGDKDKAARVVWCFAGFSEAMRGKAGAAIKDAAKFGAVNSAALADLDMSGGVSIGNEINDAMVSYVGFTRSGSGFENVPLTSDTRGKIADLYLAIAWAGQE